MISQLCESFLPIQSGKSLQFTLNTRVSMQSIRMYNIQLKFFVHVHNFVSWNILNISHNLATYWYLLRISKHFKVFYCNMFLLYISFLTPLPFSPMFYSVKYEEKNCQIEILLHLITGIITLIKCIF